MLGETQSKFSMRKEVFPNELRKHCTIKASSGNSQGMLFYLQHG